MRIPLEEFDNLPLHDAVLQGVFVDWKGRSVALSLMVFTKTEENASPHTLSFENVSRVELPHSSPWGESDSVNSGRVVGSNFEIEMQSGDVLHFVAETYALTATY